MIAPMKKFLLVVLESDMASLPERLARLGIAHIDRFESTGRACADLDLKAKNVALAKSALQAVAGKAKHKPASDDRDPDDLANQALSLSREKEKINERLSQLQREMDRIVDWGDFDPELVRRLSSEGVSLRLFEGSAAQRAELSDAIDYLVLSSPKGRSRIATCDGSMPEGFTELKLPDQSLSAAKAERELLLAKLSELEGSMQALADCLPLLEKHSKKLESLLLLERLRSGMPGEETLRYVTGYVPAKAASRFAAEAKSHSWALSLSDPEPEDLPPTKIENHPTVKIIQPVFDFLGTVPHYREYDISASFLVFFAFYFAMIFGDGGYGILMLLGALSMLAKAKASRRPLSDFAKLLFVLSGMTLLWGFLTATWFAIPFESLPGILQNLSLTALNGSNPESGTNTKILCFLIGAVQLAFAHLKNIKRDFPNLKFLAQIGSLAMVVGMLNAVLNLVIDASRFPLYGISLALIGIGFGLVFVFGNWDGNLLKSILEGLKGIIPTFLGTVSVFADIVSYIRLWAVGLAGLAISQTVNGMAIMLIGPIAGRVVAFLIGGVMALVLLLVGHSINFLMSVLSVIVHGIRLNMLEYSSHLGMEWSGYKYDPLGGNSDESNG